MFSYKISGGNSNNTPATFAPKDITFYDYDGTIVASWTLAELATKTALPDYPSHEGLTCQGWNWSLDDLKNTNRKMNVGAMYITDDDKTRIYIRLEEGRTSPALAVCPNGTVTVDWGDGTTPNTLTGTSITDLRVTPNHSYATPGEYVIKLTVDGAMGICGEAGSNSGSAILRYSIFSDARNYVYRNSVQKIEFGSGVSSIGAYAFAYCYSLASIAIPNSVQRIEDSAFSQCYSLASATIPNSVTSIDTYAFNACYSLVAAIIPNSVTSIGNNSFAYCTSLVSATIPNSVTSIKAGAFSGCHSLASIAIPNSVTSIEGYIFQYCYSLASIAIPNNIPSIGNSMFFHCYSLVSATIPNSVTSIGNTAFSYCYSAAFYDFSNHTSVPTLTNTKAFNDIPADCQIRVPTSLVDAWKAATNWSTYADHIVGV